MAAISDAKREISSISAKLKIQYALRLRPSPATQVPRPAWVQYTFLPRKIKNGQGLSSFEKVNGKEVSVNIDKELKHFELSHILPEKEKRFDEELEHIMESLNQFSADHHLGLLLTEVLHPINEREALSKLNSAKIKELEGLVRRGVFQIVRKAEISEGANIIGSRFALFIRRQK